MKNAEATLVKKDSASKPQWKVLDPKDWDPKVFGQCKFCGSPIEKRIYTKGICTKTDCFDMLKQSTVDRFGNDNYDSTCNFNHPIALADTVHSPVA